MREQIGRAPEQPHLARCHLLLEEIGDGVEVGNGLGKRGAFRRGVDIVEGEEGHIEQAKQLESDIGLGARHRHRIRAMMPGPQERLATKGIAAGPAERVPVTDGETQVILEPLPTTVMEQILAGLVPGLPQDLRDRILDRAEGVPLYAVETVRMLLDRGLLVQDGPAYRPTGAIDSLEVPETLHALIAARLDGLQADERRLLQDGAVLGKTFTKLGLEALTGVPDEELEPLLAGLLRKEILSIQADPRSPERGQYSFLQDIVKHVAYETISKKERKAKHLAAARFLSSVSSAEEDEIVEVVASHYLDAYAAAPEDADAEEIRSKAREMLVRAGERASSLAANLEAQKAK